MSRTIDFDSLLNNLFQENTPIEEKVQGHPQCKRNGADISKALSEIFQAETNADDTHMHEDKISSLQACSLYVFMRKIVMGHFGMGYDYAFTDSKGTPLKSWFTIPEAIETARKQGYRLTVAECRAYLDGLIKQRYIETDGYKYRRCALWDKRMEVYLQRYCLAE